MIAVYPHSVPLNRENVPNCYLSSSVPAVAHPANGS
ncbi:MAG: hypothetical protein V7643_3517, partial [Mycobacterium sp.]